MGNVRSPRPSATRRSPPSPQGSTPGRELPPPRRARGGGFRNRATGRRIGIDEADGERSKYRSGEEGASFHLTDKHFYAGTWVSRRNSPRGVGRAYVDVRGTIASRRQSMRRERIGTLISAAVLARWKCRARERGERGLRSVNRLMESGPVSSGVE